MRGHGENIAIDATNKDIARLTQPCGIFCNGI